MAQVLSCLLLCLHKFLKKAYIVNDFLLCMLGNSAYSFSLIVLKLCRSFVHGLKMCMWFGVQTLDIMVNLFF